MYSILSKNGYGILKSALDEYKLESIKKDLNYGNLNEIQNTETLVGI